jgi:hypothetical protein
MEKKVPQVNSKGFVDVRVLQRAARTMLPFYRAVAVSEVYARKWSKAVVKTDIDRMAKLLAMVSPLSQGLPLGSNGIGYFVGFPIRKTQRELTNGTTIPPGTVQFVFEPKVHRAIACAVFPLYRELAYNRAFAVVFTKAVGRRDLAAVKKLVRMLVHTPALRLVEVGVEEGGVSLTFKYKFSKYEYRNLLFVDTV